MTLTGSPTIDETGLTVKAALAKIEADRQEAWKKYADQYSADHPEKWYQPWGAVQPWGGMPAWGGSGSKTNNPTVTATARRPTYGTTMPRWSPIGAVGNNPYGSLSRSLDARFFSPQPADWQQQEQVNMQLQQYQQQWQDYFDYLYSFYYQAGAE